MIAELNQYSRRNILSSLVVLGIGGRAMGADKADKFVLFDSLLHRGKPNLQRAGLQSLPPVANIWRNGASKDLVDEVGVQLALKHLPRDTSTFFIDIENWPVLKATPEIRRESIGKLIRVVSIARQVMPHTKFGFYGLPPTITYWPLVDRRPADYNDWVNSNNELAALAEVVDFILPSLYTFYDDRSGWLTYADKTIRAARQYGKPVYPFLWYEYHDSNFFLRGHEIALAAWIEELQFCHNQCDGVVLWGGAERGWSESAKWWQAVRSEFNLTT